MNNEIKHNEKIRVELLFSTPISLVQESARISHGLENITENSTEENIKLLKKLLSYNHMSVFEHQVFHFRIYKITRQLLQELVRHRIASYTVESTRFTLKKILKYKDLDSIVNELTYCPTEKIKEKTKVDFQFIIDEMKNNPKIKNDVLKYYLPENYLVNRIAFTINFRQLINLFDLRLSKRALKEFQDLSKKLFYKLPKEYQELYLNYLKINNIEREVIKNA